VKGTIPDHATGTLFRTGLGARTLESNVGTTFRVHHWFDGFAKVHRFQIHAPTTGYLFVRVAYNSRSSCDGVLEQIKRTGKDEAFAFGANTTSAPLIFISCKVSSGQRVLSLA
jgi:torulene dioxygenase